MVKSLSLQELDDNNERYYLDRRDFVHPYPTDVDNYDF